MARPLSSRPIRPKGEEKWLWDEEESDNLAEATFCSNLERERASDLSFVSRASEPGVILLQINKSKSAITNQTSAKQHPKRQQNPCEPLVVVVVVGKYCAAIVEHRVFPRKSFEEIPFVLARRNNTRERPPDRQHAVFASNSINLCKSSWNFPFYLGPEIRLAICISARSVTERVTASCQVAFRFVTDRQASRQTLLS